MERVKDILPVGDCCCDKSLLFNGRQCLRCQFALAFDKLIEEACEVASAQFSEHRRSEAKGIRHHCRGCELAQAIRLKLKGGEDEKN